MQMRIIVKVLLMGLVAAAAGCNSHESKEVHNGDRDARNRAVVDNARGRDTQIGNFADAERSRDLVNPASTCINGPVNQAAGQVVGAVDAAAAKTEQVSRDVNRTAEHVQNEVQQAANDAAQLSNDANRAVNSAARDLDRLKNAFR
jgi:methyl-accepting chemotaxis protein